MIFKGAFFIKNTLDSVKNILEYFRFRTQNSCLFGRMFGYISCCPTPLVVTVFLNFFRTTDVAHHFETDWLTFLLLVWLASRYDIIASTSCNFAVIKIWRFFKIYYCEWYDTAISGHCPGTFLFDPGHLCSDMKLSHSHQSEFVCAAWSFSLTPTELTLSTVVPKKLVWYFSDIFLVSSLLLLLLIFFKAGNCVR